MEPVSFQTIGAFIACLLALVVGSKYSLELYFLVWPRAGRPTRGEEFVTRAELEALEKIVEANRVALDGKQGELTQALTDLKMEIVRLATLLRMRIKKQRSKASGQERIPDV